MTTLIIIAGILSLLLFGWSIGSICWMAHIDRKFNRYNRLCGEALQRARLADSYEAVQLEKEAAQRELNAMKAANADFKKALWWPQLIGRWSVDYYKETA